MLKDRDQPMYTYPRTFPRFFALIRAHSWRLALLFAGVLLPLGAFGALAEDVLHHEGFWWDDPILRFAHQLETPGRDAFMLLISRLGFAYGVVPLDIGLLVLLLIWKRRSDALFFGLAVGGAAALNLAAKAFFARTRPSLWDVIAPEMTYSFPSGHAMGSMALAAALVVLAWPTRWRWPALVGGGLFTLLVGCSRVYLGVHYPSDVLAGWAASFAWVIGLSLVLYGRAAKPHPDATPTLPADTSAQAQERASAR